MSLRLRGAMAVGLAAALMAATGRAEEPKAKKTDNKGRAAGVIIKVEPIGRGDRARSLRLTINTAAVWRDWARDQANQSPSESPKKAAEKGANSVATKGEPADQDTTIVVDLTPETTVETRFRAPEDETGKGAKSPEAAKGESGRRDSARPTRFEAKDLKPGLFVEADFRHETAQNRASTVCVVRPVQDTGTTRSK